MDIAAGLSLAAMAIPQALAYTTISGTPVITGLYTILLPPLLFAMFGSSRHLIVGADSATAAVMASGLISMGLAGAPEYAAYASLLALMAGVLLLIAPLFNLGFLSDFLSRTVLVGFLTGVGLQISLAQIPVMLGLPGRSDRIGHPVRGLIEDFHGISQTNLYTAGLAIGVFVVIFCLRKISKKIPGRLIAVIASILASAYFNLSESGVSIIGEIPSGFPKLGFPPLGMSWNIFEKLVPIAFSIVVVIVAQSAATSRFYAARWNERVNFNQDLVGLGLANLGSGFSGGFVANGTPSETQASVSSGGKTQIVQIISAGAVMIALLYFTAPLAYLPSVVLATMVFLIGCELIDLNGMVRIYDRSRSEFWIAAITAAIVCLVGVEQAILMAVVLSLIVHTRRGYHPKNNLLSLDELGNRRPVSVGYRAQILPGLMIYRFNHSMYYANSNILSEEVFDLVNEADPPVRWFCIDATAIDDIDFSAAETLREIYHTLSNKGIRLIFAEVEESVQDELNRYGLTDLMGKDSFFPTLHDVEKDYKAFQEDSKAIKSQTNL